MAIKGIRKFRHKLLLALTLLIIAIILPMVMIVSSNIDSVSERKIETNLKISEQVLRTYFNSRSTQLAESLESLVITQPTIRASLATLGDEDSDNLFGEEENEHSEDELSIEEINQRLAATVDHLPIFKKSQVFALISSTGKLVFSKVNSNHIGDDVTSLSDIRHALSGSDVKSFWGGSNKTLTRLSLVPNSRAIYQIFIKAVTFQQEVKGLVVVGFEVNSALIKEMQALVRADVSVGIGEDFIQSKFFQKIRDSHSSQMEKADITKFFDKEEEYISLPVILKNSMDIPVGSLFIVRSKTQELIFYNNLKDALKWIAIVAVILAVIVAIFLSGPVTKSIASLMNGVMQVRKGNLDTVVEVDSNDEFKTLSESFNQMTHDLKEKEMLKTTFKRYVNPTVVDSLLADKKQLKLGGDFQEVVVFFSDIAGFTSISEQLSPEEIVEFLNDYLGEMTNIIEAAGGIVDKYIGDAIMAYWLVTENLTDGKRLACESAIAQRAAVQRLKALWQKKPALANFDMRVGIHTGVAIMGNIGSENRMDYTLIGDTVNTAARLEAVNKAYGTTVMVSEDIAEELKSHFHFREADAVQVVGKNESVKIFELQSDENIEFASLAESFQQALKVYKGGDFTQSLQLFKQHLNHFPSDKKISELFIKRCEALIAQPPENWQGIFKLTSK